MSASPGQEQRAEASTQHQPGGGPALSSEQLHAVLRALRARTGHDLTRHKARSLVRSIELRMRAARCEDVDQYLRLMEVPEESAELLQACLVGATRWFRDSDTFALLGTSIVPPFFHEPSSEPVRVWVAGCASGEEAYSLAIVLLEQRERCASTRPIQIFATDLDEEALHEARLGLYPASAVSEVSPERLARYFVRQGERVGVAHGVRDEIVFATHDILRDVPFSRLHLLSCRNLLIYLPRDMQEHVLCSAHFGLLPEGALLLGRSEDASAAEHLFEAADRTHRVYRRRAGSRVVLPRIAPRHVPMPSTPLGGRGRSRLDALVTSVDDDLARTRDRLEMLVAQYGTVIQELQASNDELQEANARLVAATHDLKQEREAASSANLALSRSIEQADASRAEIASLMESSDIGMVFVNRRLEVSRYTQRAGEILRIADADVGRAVAGLTMPIDYPALADDAHAVVKTLQPIDRKIHHIDGRCLLVGMRPYRAVDHLILGVVITLTDVTALRRTEHALRQKEATLQLAERAANCGVWQLGSDGSLHMSERCRSLHASASTSASLADWTRVVAAYQREGIVTAIQSALRERSGEIDLELHLAGPSGDRWLWMLGCRRDPHENLSGITLDVTSVRDADRRKDQFIATLAHELRNPLTPMAMALDILDTFPEDPAHRAAAQGMLHRQVAQLRRLVDDLLDVSRIKTGRLELRVERGVSLTSVIEQACEAARPLLAEQRHSLVIRVPDVMLDGDRARLTQVFLNLVANAAKYSDPGREIALTTSLAPDTVTVAVTDQGIGIPADLLPHVFDLFVQADRGHARSRGGLGIGLNLVKQLVHLHGGSITAESAGLGNGSRFSVTLPLHQP